MISIGWIMSTIIVSQLIPPTKIFLSIERTVHRIIIIPKTLVFYANKLVPIDVEKIFSLNTFIKTKRILVNNLTMLSKIIHTSLVKKSKFFSFRDFSHKVLGNQ
uniref:Uncharacterized protein n=1 Tax=Romanomermis culicivorax TaxID=13658 RepID=A0A915JRP8_ROMCU